VIAQDNDATVLACLRRYGPGTITVKQLAQMAELPRVTVRASVDVLAMDGLVCLMSDCQETTYMIRHLHAEAGLCEQPLGAVIQDVHPDGQG
jgi:DNA-binding IclR family transcriptional regulator